LTFNGTTGTTYYYDTSTFNPGDVQQIALQASASSLGTGRYAYSMQVVDHGMSLTTTTYSGTATVLNESSDPLGAGWSVAGLEQITSASGGVILSLGAGGASLWFASSGGSGAYTSPAGDFSTLTQLPSGGGWTRTLTDGTEYTFNSSGYETASIDRNGLHTTFSYDGSNQLSSIEDPYGNLSTFTYSGGYLNTIQDPSSRLTSFTFSGGNLEAVQQADSSRTTYTYDADERVTGIQTSYGGTAGPQLAVGYDSGGRITSESRTIGGSGTAVNTSFSYDAADRQTMGSSGGSARWA
jgi:YD repeat-containing protein